MPLLGIRIMHCCFMRYQMKSRKTVTVLKNSYVVLNRHHYSVPDEYIGKRVDII